MYPCDWVDSSQWFISSLQARLFEIAFDAVHGLVADYVLVAQFDQGPALRS
jgi:hypothetical protein